VALRPPPGRAGRLWLLHRIDSGHRGGEVLDQKRQALLREEARLRGEVERAEAEWRERAAEASAWLRRAAVLGGERALGLACFYAGGSAEVELVWRNTLGVSHPAEARLSTGEEKAPFLGSPALVPAAEAHRRALEAAGRLGAARASHDRVAAELALTARRLRTIERRWLPEHRDALQTLELRLDEEEREESARVRWTVGRDRRFAPDRSIRGGGRPGQDPG
jgi:V/A-type H+-transporting ATPase subunit D